MPSINQMRHEIAHVYGNKPGWRHRVAAMPDNQITAIYKRFMQLNMDPEVIKKDGSRSKTTLKQIQRILDDYAAAQELHGKTVYYCIECQSEYVRDNPDLCVCEVCGSSMIERSIL